MPQSRGDIVIRWEKLAAAFRANPEAAINVEPVLHELETLGTEIRTLSIQQAVQTAAAQQTAQDIEVRVKRGTLLAGRLRSAAKAFYGDRTEKVVEFGMRPFRKPVRSQRVLEKVVEKIVVVQAGPEQAGPETATKEGATQPAKPIT